MQELDIAQNKLNGSIPKELFTLSSLALYLNVSKNSLSGSLPVEVGSLKNVASLVVSDNQLSGEIPGSLGECDVLEYLYMDGNLFNGTIPQALSTLRGIRVLDFSRNNLSGNIPEFLHMSSSLQYLNLSFNNFEGEVPTDGVFKYISDVSLVGNSKLCGGIPELHLRPCEEGSSSKEKHKVTKVLISVISIVLCLATLSVILVVLCKLKKRKSKSSSSAVVENQHTRVTYSDLLRATDGFSASNLIGEGSFGSVYKGIIDATAVAIKVLNLQQHGASKSFIAECEALRNIRHLNLVKIITSCSTIDYRGNDFKALVLKYMPNGNLDSWLHASEGQTLSARPLKLSERLVIAIDMASGLDYLHHHAGTQIVHRDLKPSNVLLDEEMRACLCDFGLSKFLHDKVTECDGNHSKSTGLKGTIGYVAPEYGMGGEASVEGDIYSYGIVLLELLTGKRPTDNMFSECLSLHQYVRTTRDEDILNIVDPALLLSVEHQEERMMLLKCVDDMSKIGLACSYNEPKERRQMGDVLNNLNAIRKMLNAS